MKEKIKKFYEDKDKVKSVIMSILLLALAVSAGWNYYTATQYKELTVQCIGLVQDYEAYNMNVIVPIFSAMHCMNDPEVNQFFAMNNITFSEDINCSVYLR